MTESYVAVPNAIDYNQSAPPPDIASQNENADLTELAEFAWQEFIALNWPAASNGRGAPDTGNSFLAASKVGTTYLPVWQTYWHRNELFPPEGSTVVEPKTTSTALPIYQYDKAIEASGTTPSFNLWNNLSEVNELGEDIVFAHSTASKANPMYQVLYEAKMNYDGSNYIYTTNLADVTTRTNLKNNNIKDAQGDKKYNGVCDAPAEYICLPCGDVDTGVQGNIEVKAGWRKLTNEEASSNKYHTQNVLYYENVTVGGTTTQYYKNSIMGLVGLHIIHKTKTFPDFVYATWEHKDNLTVDPDGASLVYTELQQTPFGDVPSPPNTNNLITRTHPIPNSITNVNNTVGQYLASQNSVWQNYKLINVQAKPRDLSTVVGSKTDTINSSYYLSNSVIESNIELQTFTGSTNDPKVTNVIYDGKAINMGGCMGCHGNAQTLKGSDFNFLIANAPFEFPEFIGTNFGCPSGGAPFDISTWQDVLNYFNNCAPQIPISGAPHMEFWQAFGNDQKSNYCAFTNGSLYLYGSVYKVCEPGNSQASTIIQIMTDPDKPNSINKTGYYMPANTGLKFTEEQIATLAAWIDAGCPFGDGTTTPSSCNYTAPTDPNNPYNPK